MLNSNYSFENFKINDSNKFAYSTAKKFAEDSTIIDPFYIYGESNEDKKHLMFAVANAIHNQDSKKIIKYLKASDYVNDYNNNDNHRKYSALEKEILNCDILLIEDISSFSNNINAQMRFVRFFNKVFGKIKIVVTSNKPVKELSGFLDRFSSRLAWGLQVEI